MRMTSLLRSQASSPIGYRRKCPLESKPLLPRSTIHRRLRARVLPVLGGVEVAAEAAQVHASAAQEEALVPMNVLSPELALEIAANSPLAVEGAKAVLRAGENRSIEEALDYMAVWNAAFLTSNDLREAVTAFLEKRPPEFDGT